MVEHVCWVPDGLAPGSENAIPAILGWPPRAPVDRAAFEAAARGIDAHDPWRVGAHDALPVPLIRWRR